MWQFDKHGKVGTVLPERRMRGMPDPLPAEDAAARCDLDPFGVEGVTAMAEPLRSELPSLTMAAALHQEPALTQSLPVRRRQPVGLGPRNGQAPGKIGGPWFVAHNVAPEPRRRSLTGVTIGPPITRATSLRCTWLVEVPRTWRTASSTSSKPCM